MRMMRVYFTRQPLLLTLGTIGNNSGQLSGKGTVRAAAKTFQQLPRALDDTYRARALQLLNQSRVFFSLARIGLTVPALGRNLP